MRSVVQFLRVPNLYCGVAGMAFSCAVGVVAAETPTSRPTTIMAAKENAAWLTPDVKLAKSALADGRYKEARDSFLKAAAADPKNAAALHGAGVASVFLQENEPAVSYLERAIAASPSPSRALSYNFAVADMNRGNYKRAAETLRNYLYARPKTIDEPLADALGAILFQTADKNSATRASDPTRKFFSVYVAMLEQQRPGHRKWGLEWLPTSEVASREKRMSEAETTMTLLTKELADSKGRINQYTNELRAAKQRRGARSSGDASKLLNEEEKQFKLKKSRYDEAVATIDTVRPRYPQLLLPLGMDETMPPPLVPLPIAIAPTPALETAATSTGLKTPAKNGPADLPVRSTATPTSDAPPAAVGKVSVDSGVISADQLRQCRVEADGAISVEREMLLSFAGTKGRDYVLTGELFLGGQDEANGALFCLREQDGKHRYEVTASGVRAKRVMVEGQVVAQSAYAAPIKGVSKNKWIPFRLEVGSRRMTIAFDGQSGTVDGPLSTEGGNGVLLRPGGKLRGLKLDALP